eukprot:TRINITY_DN27100_c0_g2_i1.p1 TRINITY_DN27100_c0_g2~~TRINITY_DN27100_c0_g2_i1.p1  ORF type:complete len:431 (-),score=104.49 TRINITY_DN27100_c0_g2_i1:47-1339(-)
MRRAMLQQLFKFAVLVLIIHHTLPQWAFAIVRASARSMYDSFIFSSGGAPRVGAIGAISLRPALMLPSSTGSPTTANVLMASAVVAALVASASVRVQSATKLLAMMNGASKTPVERSRRARSPISSKLEEFKEQALLRLSRQKLVHERDLLEAREIHLSAEQKASAMEAKLQRELVELRTLSSTLLIQLSVVRQAYDSMSDELEASQQESFAKVDSLAEQLGTTAAQLESAKQREASLEARLLKMEEKGQQAEKEQQLLVQQLSRAERVEGELENQLDAQNKLMEKLTKELVEERNNSKKTADKVAKRLEEEQASRQELKEHLDSEISKNETLRVQRDAMAMKVKAQEQDLERVRFDREQEQAWGNCAKQKKDFQAEISAMLNEVVEDDHEDSFKAAQQLPKTSCVRNGSLPAKGTGKGERVAARTKGQI